MIADTSHVTAFHETLLALGQEQLDNLVIVGGWCPYLYSEYIWKKELPYLKTMDIDFAVKSMSPDRFSIPVYKKLVKANLIPRREDMDDENRIKFRYLDGRNLIPIDFIASPAILPQGQNPQDTPYVACDPADEVAFPMRHPPLRHEIEYKGQTLSLQITDPTAFIVSKGLLVQHRTNTSKIEKDLASVAFVLRYAPNLEEILEDLHKYKSDEAVIEFHKIMKKLFTSSSGRGFKMLDSVYQQWGVGTIETHDAIKRDFQPLLSLSSA